MNFGTDEQKDFFLPKILRRRDPLLHRLLRARGRHRPGRAADAGRCATATSTSSTARRSARRWPATPTTAGWRCGPTPRSTKHKGISMFIVAHGHARASRVVPLHLLGDHNINYTFYDDVRVPAANLVGGENNGWTLITNQLNHERVTLCSPGIIERALERRPARGPRTPSCADGRRVIDQEWVQHQPGPGARQARVPPADQLEGGLARRRRARLDVADASTIKVFGTEFYLEAFRLLMEVVGEPAYLRRRSPEAVLRGRLEMSYRGLVILTFGGGTNEIQRDLIAIFGLGMPRSRVTGETSWTSPYRRAGGRRRAGGQIFAAPDRRAAQGGRGRPTTVSTASCGQALASAGLLGISLPRSDGGAGLVPDDRASCSSRPGGGRRRCRCWRPWCSARCRSPRFGTAAQQRRRGSRVWWPGQPCSPPPWSRSRARV